MKKKMKTKNVKLCSVNFVLKVATIELSGYYALIHREKAGRAV